LRGFFLSDIGYLPVNSQLPFQTPDFEKAATGLISQDV
jgi:hypothetical protein